MNRKGWLLVEVDREARDNGGIAARPRWGGASALEGFHSAELLTGGGAAVCSRSLPGFGCNIKSLDSDTVTLYL